MTLDEAIQHCKEQVQEQAKKGCYSCAEEHQQLAEWLKELKAYRSRGGQRMNEAEKERLIKKDIASIENRVRHAFNQGYEMGVKESRSEFPNTCGDAISRDAAVNAIYDLCGENVSLKENPWRDNPHMDAVVDALENLPSVTPQTNNGMPIDVVNCWIGKEVLFKIRERVELEKLGYPPSAGYYRAIMKVLQIIDKYMAESEDKE